jgi:hypothetical protein
MALAGAAAFMARRFMAAFFIAFMALAGAAAFMAFIAFAITIEEDKNGRKVQMC